MSLGSSSIANLEFTFLGTGTSAGVPVIACDCPVCTSSDSRDRRLRTSAALSFADADGQPRCLLIDASPDLRQQALREKLVRCDGIVFTHDHVDHIFGLDEVRLFNARMKSPIEVWAEDLTMEGLLRVYRHIFFKERNPTVSFVASLVPKRIDPSRPVDLFGLRFTPLRLLHGNLPILGYRIEALDVDGEISREQPDPLPLGYLTDVSVVPDGTYCQLGGLRTLVLDLLRYKPHPTHLSVEQAIDIAERIAAERTWFVHMTHDILHAELDPKLPEDMSLAYDGLCLGKTRVES